MTRREGGNTSSWKARLACPRGRTEPGCLENSRDQGVQGRGRLSTSPWAQESGEGQGGLAAAEVPAETSGAVRAQAWHQPAPAQREAPDERCSGEPERHGLTRA